MHVLLPRLTTASWANAATCNLCHELLRHVRTCQDWLQTHPTQWTITTIPIRILFEQTAYIPFLSIPVGSKWRTQVVYFIKKFRYSVLYELMKCLLAVRMCSLNHKARENYTAYLTKYDLDISRSNVGWFMRRTSERWELSMMWVKKLILRGH